MSEQNVKAVPQATQKAARPTPVTAPAAPAQAAAPAGPAFRVQSSKNKKRYSNTLLYGDYGVGKTTLAASASDVPEMRDVFFVNAEGGDESILGHYDFDSVDISSFTQFAKMYEYLRLHCKYRDMYVKDKSSEAKSWLIKYEEMLKGEEILEPKLYHTVIVDSLTEVQKYCMYQLLGIKVGEYSLDLPPSQPEWTEWGQSAEMIRLLVRTFRDLPMHTIFVCAMGSEQDHQKKYHYGPLLPGKLANEILGFFDTVGFMVAGPTEGGDMHRRLWLEPGQTFKAKNRFRDFKDRYIDYPTMADLAKLQIKL